jgi:hypothetical protein
LNLKKLLIIPIVIVGLIFIQQAAHAALVIDSFVTVFDVSGESGWNGTSPSAVGPGSGVTSLTQTGIAGAVGDRTATFTGDNSRNALIIASGVSIDNNGNIVSPAPGQGILTINTQAGSMSYDMEMSYAVTDLDMSMYDRFVFNFSGDLDDRTPPASLPFTISLTSGTVTDEAGVTLSADGGPYEILFSDFSGIDFSDIDGISLLSSDGVLSPDFGISSITAVPVPGAVWLLVSGLIGLIGLRKRNRK